MKQPPAAPAPQKDKRLLALLALAMLLLGIAAGVELCRRLFFKTSPEMLAGDYQDFKLPPPPPPAPPEPEPAAQQPPEREITASRFLTVLAKETPKPVAKRFLAAFRDQPGLTKVFKDATRRGLDKTPARELIGALMKVPAFREIVVEFRSDPGFRQAFAQLARNAEVGGTLRSGTTSLVRAPSGMALPAPPVRGKADAELAAAGPYTGAVPPTALSEAPDVRQPPRDERRERTYGRDAHNVNPKLGKIETVGDDYHNSVSYFASAFVGMSPQQLKKLEEIHDDLAATMPPGVDIDPVHVCNLADLLRECARACSQSRTCPPKIKQDFREAASGNYTPGQGDDDPG